MQRTFLEEHLCPKTPDKVLLCSSCIDKDPEVLAVVSWESFVIKECLVEKKLLFEDIGNLLLERNQL